MSIVMKISRKYKRNFDRSRNRRTTGSTNTFEEIEFFWRIWYLFVKTQNYQNYFYILQSGTKVMEMRNIGIFDSNVRIKNQILLKYKI